MISPVLAAKAYAAVQNRGATGGVGAEEAAGPDFGAMVKNAMNDTVGASRRAEAQVAAHTVGKAELVDVVTAVSSAEASLETVMAIRDQVISAYQEIMKTPI